MIIYCLIPESEFSERHKNLSSCSGKARLVEFLEPWWFNKKFFVVKFDDEWIESVNEFKKFQWFCKGEATSIMSMDITKVEE